MLFKKLISNTVILSPPDKLDEECNKSNKQNYKISQDNVILSPSYSPVLPHSLRVLARFIGEVTFGTQRQRYEFIDRSSTEMDISYVIYHENQNAIILPTQVSSNQHFFLPFPLVQNLFNVRTDTYIFQSSN